MNTVWLNGWFLYVYSCILGVIVLIGYRYSQYVYWLIFAQKTYKKEIEREQGLSNIRMQEAEKLSELRIKELNESNIVNTIIVQSRQEMLNLCKEIPQLSEQPRYDALSQLAMYGKISPMLKMDIVDEVIKAL